MKIDIKTNNHFRELIQFYELPEKVQAEIKDNYSTIEESTFFKYRGEFYDLSDFPRFNTAWTGESPFPSNWHAYSSFGYGCGLLIELSNCCEMVKVGGYIS